MERNPEKWYASSRYVRLKTQVGATIRQEEQESSLSYGKRQRYFDGITFISCKVGTLSSYSKVASQIRIGKLTLDEGFTVLSPQVKLRYGKSGAALL